MKKIMIVPVRREDLIKMLRRQIALGPAGGDRLLRPHHDCVREAAQQHDQRQDDVHDADALVVDGGEPLLPQIGPISFPCDEREDGHDREDHHRRRGHDNRLIERDCAPSELAEEVHFVALSGARHVNRVASLCRMPDMTMLLNRPGATSRNVNGAIAALGFASSA
jgi:hypothetical protein